MSTESSEAKTGEAYNTTPSKYPPALIVGEAAPEETWERLVDPWSPTQSRKDVRTKRIRPPSTSRLG